MPKAVMDCGAYDQMGDLETVGEVLNRLSVGE